MRGHRLLQGLALGDAAGERASNRAALALGRKELERQAGEAPQLVDDALAYHRHRLAHRPWVEVAQVGDRIDTETDELGERGPAYAPDLGHRDPAEPVIVGYRIGEVADAESAKRPGSRRALDEIRYPANAPLPVFTHCLMIPS